jgi:WD40 repeat protein
MRDGKVRVWRQDGTPLYQFALAPTGVGQVVFHPGGRWLLAGERGYPGRVWDVRTGDVVLTTTHIACSFARDGRRFAAGTFGQIAFLDLLPPNAVRPFTGHGTAAGGLTWSGDSRRLASLDSTNELRVWDVPRGDLLHVLKVPAAEYWIGNAGTALDHDGRWLAYASGGRRPEAVVHDLRAGKRSGPWRLPRGFERMVRADGRFLLVREEEVEPDRDRLPLQSVAYELGPDGPRQRRVLRPAEPGETGFHSAALTPDGRYYCWVGPRRPADRLRVEIREVATGRRVAVERFPQTAELTHASALLSPDGRHLLTAVPRLPNYDPDNRLYDLHQPGAPTSIAGMPSTLSRDGRWAVVLLHRGDGYESPTLALRPFPPGRPTWLELVNPDHSTTIEGGQAFSPDGRYLAYAAQNGTLTVVDLPAVRAELAAFEHALAGP